MAVVMLFQRKSYIVGLLVSKLLLSNQWTFSQVSGGSAVHGVGKGAWMEGGRVLAMWAAEAYYTMISSFPKFSAILTKESNFL